MIQSRQGGIATTTTTLKSIELLEKEEKDENIQESCLKGIQSKNCLLILHLELFRNMSNKVICKERIPESICARNSVIDPNNSFSQARV